MIRINIISNNQAWLKHLKNPSSFIERKIDNLNKNYKLYGKKVIFCTLLLSGDKEIKKLNKKFRKKNQTTDVLSFPFYDKNQLKKKLKKRERSLFGRYYN